MFTPDGRATAAAESKPAPAQANDTSNLQDGDVRLSLARPTDDRRITFADAAFIVNKIAVIAKKDWNLDFILVASHDALPEEVKAAIAENYGKNTKAKGVVHHCLFKIIGRYFSCWLSLVSCRTIVENLAGQP